MNPTILIVDDEKHTRDGLRASLEDDFDVYVASNTQEALNVLENESVDLVLTDLRLGGEDLKTIEDAVPASEAAGDRYDPRQMAMLDSEK